MPNEKEYSFGETYSPHGSESMMFTPEAGKSIERAVSDWLKTPGVKEGGSRWGGFKGELKKGIEVVDRFGSASRTYAEQEALFLEKGPRYAKKPGTSLHETGTAVDIPESLTYFRNWLAESGQKYGWSQRKYSGTEHHFEYSKPKEDVAMDIMKEKP